MRARWMVEPLCARQERTRVRIRVIDAYPPSMDVSEDGRPPWPNDSG